MTHFRSLLLSACLLAAPMPSLHAQAPASAANEATWSEGEVRRVDRENKKITLRHGEIKNLNMPPMTMVFQVKDPALLDKAAVGTKVRFQAAQEGGSYLVTDLQPATP